MTSETIGIAGEDLQGGDEICIDIFDGLIYKIRPGDELMNAGVQRGLLFYSVPYRLSKGASNVDDSNRQQ